MTPKRNVDKGKAAMVEEEPKGPRTRSRSSALIIREQQERAREVEDRDFRLWVIWPVAGRVPSRCSLPTTMAPPATTHSGEALQSVMTPKRNVDKGKAPMLEEEPKGPRTQSRSSALIIREQQERAREVKDRVAQLGPSSDKYEDGESFYGQMPMGGQTKTEEIKTEGTSGLRLERGE
ncbi:hypothetical protein ACLOJK_004615, partial [Asimina triloba]